MGKRKGNNMDLFQANLKKEAPLADRMRPRTLEEFIGQEHIVGQGRLLRRAILADNLGRDHRQYDALRLPQDECRLGRRQAGPGDHL